VVGSLAQDMQNYRDLRAQVTCSSNGIAGYMMGFVCVVCMPLDDVGVAVRMTGTVVFTQRLIVRWK
jgi:hypothetical protein